MTISFSNRGLSLQSLATAALFAAWLGCAGGEPGSSGEAESSPSETPPAAAQAAPAPASGEEAAALASQGEGLFQSKGCIGCHTIGRGKLTGPDLQGVTDRRDTGWVVAMITNPDSMIKNDSTARQLFAEYMTPMLGVGVTQDEARALYEYLRQQGQ
jgi:mono/diheme cytochrome c family protein